MEKVITIIIPLIGLVSAVIPLMLAILALRRNRTGKTTEPLDAQSFRVLNIKRIPVEDQIWKKIKMKNLFKIILYVIILIFVAPIIGSLSAAAFYGTRNDYTSLGVIVF